MPYFLQTMPQKSEDQISSGSEACADEVKMIKGDISARFKMRSMSHGKRDLRVMVAGSDFLCGLAAAGIDSIAGTLVA